MITGSGCTETTVNQDAVSLQASSNGTFGEPLETKEQLEEQLCETQKSAYTTGTYKNLVCQWRMFFKFCKKYKLKEWPVMNHTLCLFSQHLAHKFISASSIQNYVSGVRTLHALMSL